MHSQGIVSFVIKFTNLYPLLKKIKCIFCQKHVFRIAGSDVHVSYSAM